MANLPNGNFVPVIYEKAAQLALENTLVAAKCINRNIESAIKGAGDTVNIRIIDNLVMQDYTKNGTINWTDLPDDKVQVLIDQQKALAFKIDEIDKVQADIDVLKQYGAKGGYAVANDFDQYIFSLHASAYASNVYGSTGVPIDCGYGGSEVSPVKVTAIAKRLLSKQNAFNNKPWFVGPPEFYENMMDESGKAIEAQAMGSGQSIALNGFYKSFMGFDMYESNNLATDGTYFACMFGNNEAIAGAQQINKTQLVELQDTFATGMKVLSVYGAKVVRPKALGCAYLKFDVD